MAETNLRQANAKAFVEGVVSEKDLKVVTEEGKTKIAGHLTVKTSDVNFVKFNVVSRLGFAKQVIFIRFGGLMEK